MSVVNPLPDRKNAQRPDYRLDVARVIKQTQLEYDLDVD